MKRIIVINLLILLVYTLFINLTSYTGSEVAMNSMMVIFIHEIVLLGLALMKGTDRKAYWISFFLVLIIGFGSCLTSFATK